MLYLWDKPFYRHPSYAHDLRENLRNVAVPGTGVPLSVFCYFKWTGYLLIFFVNPFLCFMGAVNVARKATSGGFLGNLGAAYRQQCVSLLRRLSTSFSPLFALIHGISPQHLQPPVPRRLVLLLAHELSCRGVLLADDQRSGL